MSESKDRLKNKLKSRRKRKNKKLREMEERFWSEVEKLAQVHDDVPPNIFPFPSDEPEQTEVKKGMPRHLIEYDEHAGVFVNEDALRSMQRKGAAARKEKSETRASDLKESYTDMRGKRARTSDIAREEAELGYPVSVRTIQRVFKK
jgi:hypothetical protein